MPRVSVNKINFAFTAFPQGLKKRAIYILVDENTRKCCLPILHRQVKGLKSADIIEIKSGEQNKNIQVCIGIWNTLSKTNADRQAVFINLGGGVICDMGGFAAATFKRGITFINIPTTLLAMADACLGGKTGIDLNNHKNEIGLFKMPELVIIYPGFLKTLGKREFFSGFAEMIKHALLDSPSHWDEIRRAKRTDERSILKLLRASVAFKSGIVLKDPQEHNLRKILNFGHTIGHALESHFLGKQGAGLLHGEAIAAGILCESYLSFKSKLISKSVLDKITCFISSLYKPALFKKEEENQLLEFMRYDKKNTGKTICFTLLAGIGKAKINQTCSDKWIRESLAYYRQQYHSGSQQYHPAINV